MEICNKTYWVTGSSQSSPCQLNLRLTTWLRLLESLQSSSRRLARRKSSWMRRAAVYGAIWTPGHVSRTGRDGTNSGDCDSAIRPPMIMGQFWLEILASSQPLDTVGDWTLLINGDLHSQTSLRWPKILALLLMKFWPMTGILCPFSEMYWGIFQPQMGQFTQWTSTVPVIGDQFMVHVLGTKALFWINWNISIHEEENGACIDVCVCVFFWGGV